MVPGATVPGRWVDAGDLHIGDVVLLMDGRRLPVEEILVRRVEDQVYNFAVDRLHNYAVGPDSVSLAEWKALVADFHKGFSDVTMEVRLQVAEDDYVATRWRMTGKHTGTFGDLTATGKTTTWTGVSTDRYEADKIVETWVDWDKCSFLEGLGLVGG